MTNEDDSELQQAFKDLAKLVKRARERMDNGEFKVTALETTSTGLEIRSAALEASMARLAEAQAHADERVSALIDIIIEGRSEGS